MPSTLIRPVILCGGRGTRLWPISRKSMPKQFSRLASDRSLLQDTIRRAEDAGCGAPLFVTDESYRFIVAGQADEEGLTDRQIVLEPEGRGTAAAIAAAAELLYLEDPDAVMLVAPADHKISADLPFAAALADAATAAREGRIVVFGVRPSTPETGYGYIRLHAGSGISDGPQPYLGFVEKPDLAAATEMVIDGCHLWNSGMVVMSVASARKAFARLAPDLHAAVKAAVSEAQSDIGFVRLGPSYKTAPAIAFDRAVLEKERGWVVPLQGGWADLGSWRGVWSESQRDSNGVALYGESLARDCRETLLYSGDTGVQVVGLGLRNIVAVATRDAVLIADLDTTQGVSEAVLHLKAKGIRQAEDFPRQHRPWGHYETLSLGDRFQVKSIVVKQGGKLSLQSHHHRAEHWVVVAGTATVTVGTKTQLLAENESVYVPLGAIHRLENSGKVPLQLIEVQTGTYLGEDDIRRYEDIYERA